MNVKKSTKKRNVNLGRRNVKPKSILLEADSLIHGDRERTYGTPGRNATNTAEMWSLYIKQKYGVAINLNADDFCIMMNQLKVARLINLPTHRDSQVDIAGYIGLMEKIQNS